jgi:hypothetical protein
MVMRPEVVAADQFAKPLPRPVPRGGYRPGIGGLGGTRIRSFQDRLRRILTRMLDEFYPENCFRYCALSWRCRESPLAQRSPGETAFKRGRPHLLPGE